MPNPHNNNPLKLYKIGEDGYPMRNIITRISYPILIIDNTKGRFESNNTKRNKLGNNKIRAKMNLPIQQNPNLEINPQDNSTKVSHLIFFLLNNVPI